MAFELTTALEKMLALDKTVKVIQGSTSSGKTYGIVPIIYDKCLATPRLKATIVAETLQSVKEGALDIFFNFMYDEGRWDDSKWNASSLTYTCSNGSKLQFKSFDTVGKAKAAGKRDILFLNEANHIDYEIADALMIRTFEEIWLDFNADMEFWAHTELIPDKDTDFIKLTYKDNEALPTKTYNDLMKRKAKAEAEELSGNKGYHWNWWQVYGLGEVGQLLEAVYPIWKVLDEKPERFQDYVYGMDFGYQHPTALVRVWYHEDELYLEEVIYQPGLTSTPTIEKMREVGVEVNKEILGDHARPEMIADIADAGFYIFNANKNVKEGIDFLNECTVYVSRDSVNIQKENRLYKRKKINGKVIEEVKKENDDAMDAIRYAALYIKHNCSGNSAYTTF